MLLAKRKEVINEIEAYYESVREKICTPKNLGEESNGQIAKIIAWKEE